jgi:hypothetical protein
MKLPCEVVVWYVVPVIKSELAQELSKRGMTQKNIAEVIDVTQAAVSQYLSGKRGSGSITLTPEMKDEIKSFADKVINGKVGAKALQALICVECNIARKQGILDKIKT